MPIKTNVIFECDELVPTKILGHKDLPCRERAVGSMQVGSFTTQFRFPRGWVEADGRIRCPKCVERLAERKLLEGRVPMPDPTVDPPGVKKQAESIKRAMKLVVADEQAYEHEVARSMDGLSDDSRQRLHDWQDKHLEPYRDDDDEEPTTH